MATLISCATGNFTTNTTWKVVDSTSILDSEANNTALTTSYVASANFTPGAIVIDGIAVKLASRAASPTGTMSIKLYNSTDGADAAGTEVAVNVSDLPTCSTTENEGGWFLVSFSAVTLIAGKNYQVHAKTSSSSQVNLYRNATTGNWSRFLRTTTNAAPAATDVLHVMGEHTGAGTSNSFVVTMENTATTDFGAGTDSVPALTINQLSTLNFAYSSGTNYYLKLSGDLIIYNGGTFTVGTVSNPIPRDSTAVVEFDPVADGGNSLQVRGGGTCTVQGLSRSSGKNVVSCKLNTDEAAAQTTLGIDTDTGWLSGDQVAISSTTRTPAEAELRTLDGNAGVSSIAVTAGLTNAHSGTSPTQAEVILLTRNVKFRSATSTIGPYCTFKNNSVVDIDWAEFRYFGQNGIPSRWVFVTATMTSGSVNIQYCSAYDTRAGVVTMAGTGVEISNNTFYNINTTSSSWDLCTVSSTGTNVFSNNIFIRVIYVGASNTVINVNPKLIVFDNNVVSSVTGGSGIPCFRISNNTVTTVTSFSGNVAHSSTAAGFDIQSVCIGSRQTLGSLTAYRNTGPGLQLGISSAAAVNYKIQNFTAFGNTTRNIGYVSGSPVIDLIFTNANINSEASYTTTNGLCWDASGPQGTIKFIDSNFGTTYAHTTDLNLGYAGALKVLLYNTTLASGTTVTDGTGFPNSLIQIKAQKNGGVSTAHKVWSKFGTIQSESTIRHTASGYSWKMIPNTTGGKLTFPGPTDSDSFKSAVNGSGTVTISCYMYKDSSYNGSAPRLVLLGGTLAGVTETSTAMTVAHSNWENIIVTCTPSESGVVEFYVDCDGTAGNVYVDDFSVTQV